MVAAAGQGGVGGTHKVEKILFSASGYGLEDVASRKCSNLPSSRAANLQMRQTW